MEGGSEVQRGCNRAQGGLGSGRSGFLLRCNARFVCGATRGRRDGGATGREVAWGAGSAGFCCSGVAGEQGRSATVWQGEAGVKCDRIGGQLRCYSWDATWDDSR